MSMHDYIKEKEFPLFICPGCTHGTVTNAFLHVASQMNLDKIIRFLFLQSDVPAAFLFFLILMCCGSPMAEPLPLLQG